jgi:CheY-like chemotaxis protein
MLQGLRELHLQDASRKGLGIECHVDTALHPAYLADEGRLRQVIGNLVGNALKFTQRGAITLAVRVVADEGQQTRLKFSVTDSGPGLAPAFRQRAFDLFSQGPDSQGSVNGGVGLGLFISRAIARAAGGDLTLDSAPGAGAALTLRMPVAIPSARARDSSTPEAAPAGVSAIAAPVPRLGTCAAADAAPPLPPLPMARRLEGAPAIGEVKGEHDGEPHLRCHVSDDHALNLMLVTRLLERTAGFEVDSSADGREAYDAIIAAAERGRMPHLVILDMQMPRWSGPDAARALRAWEAAQRPPRLPVPMYALTANVLEEHRAECDAAGMNGFLTKPLRAAALPELQRRAREYQQLVS